MYTDLTELIREVLRNHPTEQPEGLAKIITDQLHDPAEARAFLLELLTSRIKDIVRMDGNALRGEVLDNSNRGPNWSPKFGDRRSAWQAMLESRINVGGELKRLGGLTRAELVECAQKRRALVDQIERQIAHFESLIEMLDTYHVATLDDVPPQG